MLTVMFSINLNITPTFATSEAVICGLLLHNRSSTLTPTKHFGASQPMYKRKKGFLSKKLGSNEKLAVAVRTVSLRQSLQLQGPFLPTMKLLLHTEMNCFAPGSFVSG